MDAAIVSAAVDGYESSGSSDPDSAFPPLFLLQPNKPTDSRSAQLDIYSGPGPEPRDFVALEILYAGVQCAPVIPWYPLLDGLSEDTECLETTVIRLTSRNKLNAAPKDDPRFWISGATFSLSRSFFERRG